MCVSRCHISKSSLSLLLEEDSRSISYIKQIVTESLPWARHCNRHRVSKRQIVSLPVRSVQSSDSLRDHPVLSQARKWLTWTWWESWFLFLIFSLKIGTWANNCCQSSVFLLFLLPKAPHYIVVYSSCECLWLCYVGHHLSMAWWAVPCPHAGSEPVCTRDLNRSAPRIQTVETLGCRSRGHDHNHLATGLAPESCFLKGRTKQYQDAWETPSKLKIRDKAGKCQWNKSYLSWGRSEFCADQCNFIRASRFLGLVPQVRRSGFLCFGGSRWGLSPQTGFCRSLSLVTKENRVGWAQIHHGHWKNISENMPN